jgi:hypothetical protein
LTEFFNTSKLLYKNTVPEKKVRIFLKPKPYYHQAEVVSLCVYGVHNIFIRVNPHYKQRKIMMIVSLFLIA